MWELSVQCPQEPSLTPGPSPQPHLHALSHSPPHLQNPPLLCRWKGLKEWGRKSLGLILPQGGHKPSALAGPGSGGLSPPSLGGGDGPVMPSPHLAHTMFSPESSMPGRMRQGPQWGLGPAREKWYQDVTSHLQEGSPSVQSPRSEDLEWGQTEVGLARVSWGKQIAPALLTSRQSQPVVAQQEVLIEGLRVMASEEAGQRET